MTLEEFTKLYCFGCGSQRCYGPESEFAHGCLHYNTVFGNEEEYVNNILPDLDKNIAKRLEEILMEK